MGLKTQGRLSPGYCTVGPFRTQDSQATKAVVVVQLRRRMGASRTDAAAWHLQLSRHLRQLGSMMISSMARSGQTQEFGDEVAVKWSGSYLVAEQSPPDYGMLYEMQAVTHLEQTLLAILKLLECPEPGDQLWMASYQTARIPLPQCACSMQVHDNHGSACLLSLSGADYHKPWGHIRTHVARGEREGWIHAGPALRLANDKISLQHLHFAEEETRNQNQVKVQECSSLCLHSLRGLQPMLCQIGHCLPRAAGQEV